MATGTTIAQFTNNEDAVTSFVTKGNKGFHVSLRDDDSGSYVGIVVIFQELEKAIAKAKTIL